MILCLNKSTPNVMVYGESGRHPILLEVKQRMVTFWSKLILDDPLKMSCSVYKLVDNLYLHNIVRLLWVTRIHDILNECSFSHIYNDQFVNLDWSKSALKLRLNDQYQQS